MKSAKAEGLVLRAAIYARKSNDDNDKAKEGKSIERQLAHARDFIKHHGWKLAGDAHVYTDDAISGAEFKNRPGQENGVRPCLLPSSKESTARFRLTEGSQIRMRGCEDAVRRTAPFVPQGLFAARVASAICESFASD